MYKGRLVFGAACLGILLFGIGLITLGAVVPQLKLKFQLDEISAGTLFSILPLGILSGSLIFGPLCDKYGYKLVLSLSCFCMFIGFEGLAYAPSLGLLKICIYFFGLGGGAMNGSTSAVVSDISTKNKGANLSFLGVFFGLGAWGMPFLLAVLEKRFGFEDILGSVGAVTFVSGLFFLFIQFPPPKQTSGFPLTQSLGLVRDVFLILIAFFLFCQSSFEAIINNWTTTYLTQQLSIVPDKALYALSLYVAGMTVMRILIASVFRSAPEMKIMFASLGMILIGVTLLKAGSIFVLTVTGLILIGAGLAAGFPIMLGITGNRYKELSGTAFSFVLVIALTGNTLINYGMGVIAHAYGIGQLINVAYGELIVMVVLCLFILKKIKSNKQ